MRNKLTILKAILAISVLGGALASCGDYGDRLDSLEKSVSNLQTISEYIQSVIRENKIISEVENNGGDYVLHFTDGTSVNIGNTAEDVQSVEVSRTEHTVVITLSDGSSYVIPLWHATPSGLVLLTSKAVNLAHKANAAIPFRINPSNATVSAADISLEYAGKHFALKEIIPATDGDGAPVQGSWLALLEDLGTQEEFEDEAMLVLRTTDIAGETAAIWSNAFTVKSVSLNGINTGLPFVIIDTPDAMPITSKEDWMPSATMTILNPDLSVSYQGTLSIKGRGNSTWTQFPKKPYALKLDSKSEILGMKKHKRWCLLANWMDRTLIRNDVAFEISRRTELAWTPSGRFVELILNGKHLGNYYLCEQVKVDENRVNTDGFLMEVDAWFDEQFKFRTPIHDVPWQFKDPDEVTQEQFDYMYAYVDEFEKSIYDDARFATREYTNYIDCDSWVDWWLVNELAQNGDVNQPKSIYISKDLNGKLVLGPVWDFDWGTFIPVEFNPNAESYNYYCRGPKFYLNRICKEDPQFRALAKEHWARFGAKLATIPEYIDKIAGTLEASDALNIAMWPIDRTTNQDVNLSYADAVARLKRAYIEKYEWMDNIIKTY